MRYLILIQSNERLSAVWENLSDEQRMDFGRNHLGLSDQMAKAGVHVASEGLADPSLSRWVSARDGRTVVSDGPFAEAKEHLAGFYLIECETFDEAVEWAAKVPDAAYVEVEVRPVLDMSSWDL
jgi:hypothetical protein